MEPETFTPIILDLGKKTSSDIKKLKKGEGDLMQEIEYTYNSIKSQLVKESDGKEVIPVIVIYQEKVKEKTNLPFPFPIPRF